MENHESVNTVKAPLTPPPSPPPSVGGGGWGEGGGGITYFAGGLKEGDVLERRAYFNF